MRDGYIVDFVSGREVPGKPEEVEAVQPFLHVLVEDYGYPKEVIQTHPQYRVKVRPSDTKKEYPVDIAVFTSPEKKDNQLKIVVECKKRDRKDGIGQLKDYLRFCGAEIGIWTNGEERCYLRKYESSGRVDFKEIPNFPKCGQSIDDVGKLCRKDLKPTHNLKNSFRTVRNYLAANAVGATRDEVIAQQVINLIFCKIYDELWTAPDDTVKFRSEVGEAPEDVKKRILDLFTSVKKKYQGVFSETDEIDLDSNSIVYVVGELQNYCLIESERDSVADAFEVFIGHALKGGQGQFFTPRNVIRMMVDVLRPTEDNFIVDPSCGSGGFLIEVLRQLWDNLDNEAKKYGWSLKQLEDEKSEVAEHLHGIDKDHFLAKIAKAYLAIFGYGKAGIFCEDSLDDCNNWSIETKRMVNLKKYDILLTNPPFGSKIPVVGEEKLSQYELAKKWKYNRKDHSWTAGNKLKEKESPQVLFIERDIQLLDDYGKMGIVLPDGIFGNHTFGYVREWIKTQGRILAIIDIPVETFQPNTATKTSVLFFQKLPKEEIPEDYEIFMAIVKTCGHDRRGKETSSDEIKDVAAHYHRWAKKQGLE